MLKLCRVDINRSEELLAKLNSYVRAVVEKLDPALVLLFGSVATGEVNEGSDVDILVVADFKESFLDRIGVLMSLNNYGIPVEPVGYTRAEFEEMRKAGNSFILEVLSKSKVLFQQHTY